MAHDAAFWPILSNFVAHGTVDVRSGALVNHVMSCLVVHSSKNFSRLDKRKQSDDSLNILYGSCYDADGRSVVKIQMS